MLVDNTLFNDRYRLMERKGSGSFGEVWLARDGQLDMDVAVKIYIALDDRGIEEFKKEYKTAYNLNHPNLLHAYHFDVCERRPFLVMPYCPKSATSLIGCCDNDTLWRFIKDVSSGLSYLHSLDIVHHDIKPDNILITEDGRFVITDFGISTKMRSTLRRHSTRAAGQNSSGGSLPYMGPEMFTGKPESVKATDIWAFGATLYELITGELPFFGQGGVMQLNGAAVPEIDFPDNDIVSLVRACLAKETWDRPVADDIICWTADPGNNDPAPDKRKTKMAGKFLIPGICSVLLIAGSLFGFSQYNIARDYKLYRTNLASGSEYMLDEDGYIDAGKCYEIAAELCKRHSGNKKFDMAAVENERQKLKDVMYSRALEYYEWGKSSESLWKKYADKEALGEAISYFEKSAAFGYSDAAAKVKELKSKQ